MKKIDSRILIVVVSVFLLSSCSGLNKMKKNASQIKFDVTPEVAEMHGGNVDVAIEATFPAKYFAKKAVIVATPVLKSTKGSVDFKPVSMQGEKVTANNRVINFKAGGRMAYKGTVPYSSDLRVSDLVINIEASQGKKKVNFDPIKVADGVISTPTLLLAQEAQSIVARDNFKRIIPESYAADVHYVINSASLSDKEKKGADVEQLKKTVAEASKKDNVKFKGVSVSAYASPDGELDWNDKLASNRSKSASKFFSSEMAKMEVSQASQEAFFNLMATAEDWEGFQDLVSKSNIQDKDLILRVLSMYNDPVVREKEIKNISAAFTELASEILPQLRRSVMTVDVDVIGKSDAEITALASNNPKELNIEEMLYAATLTEDVKAQNGIYKAATEKYNKCYRAWNDLGMTYAQMGDFAAGKQAFDKAASLNEKSPVVLNNLGVVALVDGDFEKAEGYFRSAAGAGKEVDYNMGIINIKKGNYSQAVSNFGTAALFNAALAQTLNKDYSAALKTLNTISPDCYMGKYLKAVIYARQNNSAEMFTALEAAIAAKPELKELARTDAEFGKFFNGTKFKELVN